MIKDTATPAIKSLISAVHNLQPMLEDLAVGFETITKLSFDASTDPYGQAWQPLSDVTISRRRQGSSVIGRDTSRLFNSILPQWTQSTAGVGTNVIYARNFHYGQKQGASGETSRGAPIPWGDVPSRKILPTDELPQSWNDEIQQTMGQFFDSAWNN